MTTWPTLSTNTSMRTTRTARVSTRMGRGEMQLTESIKASPLTKRRDMGGVEEHSVAEGQSKADLRAINMMPI